MVAMRQAAINGMKRVFGLAGLDVRRRQPNGRNYSWLKSLKIDTVLDIGANTGQFVSEIREILPEAYIFSFEPQTQVYRQLLRSWGHDTRFRAFNVAVGDENCTADFHQSASSPSSSLLPMTELHLKNFPTTMEKGVEKVQVARLDDFAAQLSIGDHVLVKVDVQGAEDKVLRGGENTLRNAEIIVIESCFQELYQGQMLFKDLADFLYSLGFRYLGGLYGYLVSPLDGSNLCEDSVFIHRTHFEHNALKSGRPHQAATS